MNAIVIVFDAHPYWKEMESDGKPDERKKKKTSGIFFDFPHICIHNNGNFQSAID